jgi:phosphoribosylaminoimidazolecarboxamide formyltransferase/IMP cyclohydrolase
MSNDQLISTKDLPPPADLQKINCALLSVFDKTGLIPFARRLSELGVKLVSTGGTARAIREAGLDVRDVSDLTGYPELFDGRVKSLHPRVHAGILMRRNDPDDQREREQHDIEPIDLVVVNLYPFSQAVSAGDVTDAVAVENIDIGGPTLIRAAAKNFFFTTVVTDPADYASVADELESAGAHTSLATRRRLAAKAFALTRSYDTAIAGYLTREKEESPLPEQLNISLPKALPLRYGENPHQPAAMYGSPEQHFEKLHGKALSFNNLLDLSAALNLIDEFREDGPTCAILKHTNPCGIATADSLTAAYHNAFATDTSSPFGGIVVVNRSLDMETAQAINRIFTELIIAPDFGEGVLDMLRKKKNRRLIRMLPVHDDGTPDVRTVRGGLLVQQKDPPVVLDRGEGGNLRVVTQRQPTDSEWHDLEFAWRVVKHVKSNAIVYARGGATLGVGAGQMSRIDSSEIAVMKGAKSELDFSGCVIASDAFFPFADGLIAAAEAGAVAAIQPGGSVRDDEVIQAANERNMAMVFTGQRHFRH